MAPGHRVATGHSEDGDGEIRSQGEKSAPPRCLLKPVRATAKCLALGKIVVRIMALLYRLRLRGGSCNAEYR